MKHLIQRVSLMLLAFIPSFIHPVSAKIHIPRPLKGWHPTKRDVTSTTNALSILATTATPCTGPSCVGAQTIPTSSSCGDVNGTTIRAGLNNETWMILCDIDFYAQDIYPFLLTTTFEDCLQHCDDYNQHNDNGCAGFVFAPDRVEEANDCYLKRSVNDRISPSTIRLIGATLLPRTSEGPTIDQNVSVGVASSPTINKTGDAGLTALAASVVEASNLGTATTGSSQQYVSHPPALPIKLAMNQLQPGIDLNLITGYPLAGDTGSWTEATVPPNAQLGNMSVTPSFARDGGKGGLINGTHVFVFCDTSSYDADGMNGLVSSSATTDVNRQAADGLAIAMSDPLGQFQDDVGRLRGWIELTLGEEAFNIAISGEGFRYAVWPESSFISLNTTHSLIYASLVYLQVDMDTQVSNFTSLGNSLVAVTIDPTYGPHADRLVNQLFGQGQVEWGSLGGFRAWTASGNGSNDGMIYLFGQVADGVSVAKVAPAGITDIDQYVYWHGTEWSSSMPSNSTSASLIEQPVMDFDLFYSPYHQYFFMVYLTPFADNTFYYRYTEVSPSDPIIPPYMDDGDPGYAERMLTATWSEQQVLYRPATPVVGYIYSGGCHMGYFGTDDIAEGGNYLLITWTEHTNKDPDDPSSGYAMNAAKVKLGWIGMNQTVT